MEEQTSITIEQTWSKAKDGWNANVPDLAEPVCIHRAIQTTASYQRDTSAAVDDVIHLTLRPKMIKEIIDLFEERASEATDIYEIRRCLEKADFFQNIYEEWDYSRRRFEIAMYDERQREYERIKLADEMEKARGKKGAKEK